MAYSIQRLCILVRYGAIEIVLLLLYKVYAILVSNVLLE